MRRPLTIAPETSKQRSLRIPLDYVRTLDPIQKWKWLLALAAMLLTLCYLASFLLSGQKRYVPFSPGPIAARHATWEQNCSTCHQDFAPLRDDAINPFAMLGFARLTATGDGRSSPHAHIDAKCQACHRTAPHHQKHELAHDVASCATCHRDHQGRMFEIARTADQHCTRCHVNIAAHREGEASGFDPPLQGHIGSFSAEDDSLKRHPEFRSLAKDPGNIKFNHALHMAEGIPAFDPNSEGLKLVTLDKLPEEFVEQYRREDQPKTLPSADRAYPVRLECSSCHRPGTDSTGLEKGAYMAPIHYDRHCKACHPLTYEPTLEPTEKTLTHGLTPKQIREFLLARYAMEELKGKPSASSEPPIPKRPIPGRSNSELAKQANFRATEVRVVAAERFLQDAKTCCKCHSFKTDDPDRDVAMFPAVQPSHIPQRWFRLARFNHGSHQAMTCKECHSNAYDKLEHDANRKGGLSVSCGADATDGPMDHKIVMIAGRDVCMKCHSSRSNDGSRGGARHDCVECHLYHGGDAR